ncbi:hypothetical protein K523DRAFT_322302, partial [Schizophyllum commune Tattone D]
MAHGRDSATAAFPARHGLGLPVLVFVEGSRRCVLRSFSPSEANPALNEATRHFGH